MNLLMSAATVRHLRHLNGSQVTVSTVLPAVWLLLPTMKRPEAEVSSRWLELPTTSCWNMQTWSLSRTMHTAIPTSSSRISSFRVTHIIRSSGMVRCKSMPIPLQSAEVLKRKMVSSAFRAAAIWKVSMSQPASCSWNPTVLRQTSPSPAAVPCSTAAASAT